MSWELPVLTTLILSVVSFWWIGSPQSRYQKAVYALVYAVVCGLTLLVQFDARQLFHYMFSTLHSAAHDLRLDVLLTQHFKMVMALGAVVWLLHRSLQTLLKPVPDLINILGVDIPERPDVSLAGIRPDAATLSWTPPANNRPVQKYLIKVNGVHVGDSPGNEVAITVTGLKPNHFYNIRVVALGQNNFQAGSPVVRLRTFGKDGRPQLGNSRLPTSFTDPELPPAEFDGETDDSESSAGAVPTVEAAPVLDGNSTTTRDNGATAPIQRRNTVNRRHSPSVASADQPQSRPSASNGPKLSLAELNEKFEGIRRETEETQSQFAKDEAEFLQQEDDLKVEKDRKRQLLKEKEEQTTQLKASVRTTFEQMRVAEKERAKREQQLQDKETKKSKVRDNIGRLEKEVERMKNEREGFEAQKEELAEKRNNDILELDEGNAELQEKCAELEAELRDKGKQLQDLKAAREQLPGADDKQLKDEDIKVRKEWDMKRRDLHERLVSETQHGHNLHRQLRALEDQINRCQMNVTAFNQHSSSASEFDTSSMLPQKRLSLNSGTLSNTNLPSPGQLAAADPVYQGSGFNRGFGSGLYMDMAADPTAEAQTEAELRAAGGPLSPSAQALIPSNMFDEMDDSDLRDLRPSFLPRPMTAAEQDPLSPASSIRSLNVFSSPHGSSQNLPFPSYSEDSDRLSITAHMSPTSPPATGHRLTSLLSTFQRTRGAKATDDGSSGPPIGSLKAGQSQSFPRGADDQPSENRRKMSFPWLRHSVVPSGSAGTPPSTTKSSSARRLDTLKNSAGSLFFDRDMNSSRPASIASSDLPRPSTDSGSIWNNTGDAAGQAKNRMWGHNDGWQASRSGSRRPSLHGSNTVLTTTLASADDAILDEHELLNPQTSPSQVGVIGSRPPRGSKSISQRLNPTAPTFMANIFRKDRDRDKDTESDRDRTKGRGKDRAAKDDKGRGKEATAPSIELTPSLEESPSDSRMSRDTYSVHTQPSVSESHESLQLDATMSNTPSELNMSSTTKDESVVKKLFRKGSSSKFSLSSRLGKESALFKKGPGSATNSDKNMSAEHRSSIGDLDDLGEDVAQLGRSYDSVTSSPSLGPSKSKDSKESRMSAWRFSMKKKGKETPAKEKESLDMDTAPDEE